MYQEGSRFGKGVLGVAVGITLNDVMGDFFSTLRFLKYFDFSPSDCSPLSEIQLNGIEATLIVSESKN